MQKLIDIGANLTHDSFDADREDVIRTAIDAGVGRMLVTGASVSGSEAATKLAHAWPGVLYATAGIHPHHASEYDEQADAALRALGRLAEVRAVGECGLDYFRNFSPVDAQRKAFAGQLEIAVENRKPVFLHQRDAHDDFVEILKPRIPELTGGVAHCFTGGPRDMQEYLEMGLYIGVTGWICDERRGQDLQAAVAELPLERLLIETDAPYLLPRDYPEKLPARRNEPRLLPHIVNVIARYMGKAPDEIAAASTANAVALFGL